MVLLSFRTHHDAFDPCRDIEYLQDTMHFLGGRPSYDALVTDSTDSILEADCL